LQLDCSDNSGVEIRGCFAWNLVGSTLPAVLDVGMNSVANADSCKDLGFDGE